MENQDLIEAWVSRGLSDEALQELKSAHPNNRELLAAEQVVKESARLEPQFEVSEDELWQKLQDQLDPKETPVVNLSRRRTLRWLAVAASIAILAAVSIVLFGESHTYQTGAGETLAVNLPDGSKVTLNAFSTVDFNEDTWSQSRDIKMSGEAFFEVEKGNAFTVSTADGQVRVLGTSFNVRSRDGVFSVSCRTGKVEVTVPGGDPHILEPGDLIRFENGKMAHRTDGLDPQNHGSWVSSGYAYYNQVPLEEVLKDLEMRFGLTFEVAANLNLKREANCFTSTEDVDKALESTFVQYNDITYEFDPKTSTVVLSP